MNAQFIYRIDDGKTQNVDLPEREVVLGAERSADVPVPVEGVSRHHARLLYEDGAYWLEDLRSTNGTFVNGNLMRRTRLQHLDVITLGRLADLVFVVRDDDFAPGQKRGIIAARLVPLAEGEVPRDLPIGEITLGRAEACNIAIDESAVSKLHARIERSSEQLLFEDLGSANGSAVNGSQVSSVVLRHDDEIALAGVVRYKIEIELGNVAIRSGAWSVGERAIEEEARPQLSSEWKTRFEWSTGEYAALVEIRRMREGSDQLSQKRPVTERSPNKSKPAPVARKPEPPREATPAAPKPEPPGKPAPTPPIPVPKPPSATPPTPQDAPTPARSHQVAASGTITRLRLRGSGMDLSVDRTGHHPLGRATNAALRIRHPTVSRRHAVVILSDNRQSAFLQDDSGTNGTLLNGREITRTEPLRDGDEITIGDVTLEVVLERASPPRA